MKIEDIKEGMRVKTNKSWSHDAMRGTVVWNNGDMFVGQTNVWVRWDPDGDVQHINVIRLEPVESQIDVSEEYQIFEDSTSDTTYYIRKAVVPDIIEDALNIGHNRITHLILNQHSDFVVHGDILLKCRVDVNDLIKGYLKGADK